MKLKSENLDTSLEEAKPLLQKHWDEIAHYKDIPLNPDYDHYYKMEKAGMLKIYTARDQEARMIGYAVYILSPALHYKQSMVARQDIIYIDPQHRGVGLFLLKWCDEQLKSLGVQIVCHHVKAVHNFGPSLQRMGYELQDLIYTKRLDR